MNFRVFLFVVGLLALQQSRFILGQYSFCSPGEENVELNNGGGCFCRDCYGGTYCSSPGGCGICKTGYLARRRLLSLSSSSCPLCPPGSYCPYASDSPIICPSGSFCPTSGLSAPLPCADGFYSSSPGSATCFECPTGRYRQSSVDPGPCKICDPGSAASLDKTSCEICPPGYFCPLGLSISNKILCGAANQICPGNTTAPREIPVNAEAISCENEVDKTGCSSFSSCSPGFSCQGGLSSLCFPGRFSNVSGLTSCFQCPIGSFSSSSGAVNCSICAPGKSTSRVGSIECEGCSAGRYAVPGSSRSCLNCEQGRYSLAESTSCFNCSAGENTIGPGSTSCLSCQSGRFTPTAAFNGTCRVCPDGSASQLDSGSSSCFLCPAGYFCPVGSSRFSALPCSSVLEFCPGNSSSAFPVPIGSFATNCSKSSETAGLSRCTNSSICPSGSFCQGGIATPCAAGKFSNRTGLTSCFSCPVGTFNSLEGVTNCTVCQTGSVANRVGSEICTGCSAGFYANSIASACIACSAGFQSSAFQTACALCPAGEFSTSSGSSSCFQCQSGRYSPFPGRNSSCLPCHIGWASLNDSGSIQCLPCPAGFFCPLGSSLASKIQCASSSQFCPGETAAAQLVLPGAFATNCTKSEAGSGNGDGNFLGCTNSSLCPPGSYCQTGVSFLCTAGRFSNQTGLSSCLNCPVGRFNDMEGATNCTVCSPGTRNSRPGSVSCTGCSAGTYSKSGTETESGSEECPLCPRGSWSSGGQSECTPCWAGEFTSSSGSSACLQCQSGRYSPQPGYNSSCLGCRPGWASLADSGSTDCAPCPFGSFCPTGSSLSSKISCSSSSQYCPGGTALAQLVPVGAFVTNCSQPDSDSAKGLEKGNYDGCSNYSLCMPGSYCQSGVAALCAAGKFSNGTGFSTCLNCPLGRFNGEDGQSACKECAEGMSTTREGSVSCTGCSPGRYADSNSGHCKSCLVGQYSGENSVQCLNCSAGEFTPAPGSSACLDCQAGRFTPVSGFSSGSSCLLCPFGSFSDPHASSCSSCPVGRFINATGSSVCFDCIPGRFSLALASTGCEECAMGKFADGASSTSCQPCIENTVSSVAGSSYCVKCPESTFANSNHTDCVSAAHCSPGFGVLAGQCAPCPANMFGEKSQCRECAAGTYTVVSGSVRCLACTEADGFTCSGSRTPVVRVNYWGFLFVNPREISHVFPATALGRIELRSSLCPQGFCSGGRAPALNNPVDGNFIVEQFAGRPIPAIYINASTSRRSEGGESDSDSAGSISSFSASQCPEGRDPSPDNPLCGRCSPGLFLWNGACVECSGTNGGLLFGLLVGAFLYVGLIHLLSQRSDKKFSRSDTKILIAFVQTALFQLGPFDQYLQWLGLVNFNLTQSSGDSCLAPMSPYEQIAVATLVPFMFIVVLGAILLGQFIYQSIYHRAQKSSGNSSNRIPRLEETQIDEAGIGIGFRSGAELDFQLKAPVSNEFPRHAYFRTLLALLNFSYLRLSTLCLSFVTCISVNGSSVAFFSPSIDCNSSTYQTWSGVILTVLVLVCLYPLIIGAHLYRNRHKLKIFSETMEQAEASADGHDEGAWKAEENRAFQSFYGILYESYRPGVSWLWCSLVLVRQVLLIGLSLAFQLDYSKRYLAYCYYNLAQYSLVQWFQPHRARLDNQLESLAHLLLLVLTSLVLASQPPSSLSPASQILIVFLVIPYSVLSALMIAISRAPFGKCRKFALQLGLVERIERNMKIAARLAGGRKDEEGENQKGMEEESESTEDSTILGIGEIGITKDGKSGEKTFGNITRTRARTETGNKNSNGNSTGSQKNTMTGRNRSRTTSMPTNKRSLGKLTESETDELDDLVLNPAPHSSDSVRISTSYHSDLHAQHLHRISASVIQMKEITETLRTEQEQENQEDQQGEMENNRENSEMEQTQQNEDQNQNQNQNQNENQNQNQKQEQEPRTITE